MSDAHKLSLFSLHLLISCFSCHASEFYYFKREQICSGNCEPIESVAEETLLFLQKHAPPDIQFDPRYLFPFDKGGTCSAMAFDLVGRYLMLDQTLETFAPYYKTNTAVFSSRQAAFNTITVDKKMYKQNPELMRWRKVQALANFHGLSVEPVSSTLKIKKLDENRLHELTTRLDEGCYLIRTLIPSHNRKREKTGHTLILIKEEDWMAFYDNSIGAVELGVEDLPRLINSLNRHNHHEVRFYRVEIEGEPLIHHLFQQ